MNEEEKKHAIQNLDGLWESTEVEILREDPSNEKPIRIKGKYIWF